jgi:hypothetical protein
MRPATLLSIGLLLGLSACISAPEAKQRENGKRMKHENGLIIVVSDTVYETEKTAYGFRLIPAGTRDTRRQTEILVELKADPPPGEFSQTRSLDGIEARYRIDADTGGSGGEERTLTAFKPSGSRYIYLTQTVQSEMPHDSAFDPAWKLLSGAHIE